MGEGKVSDLLRPAIQLAPMAPAFREAAEPGHQRPAGRRQLWRASSPRSRYVGRPGRGLSRRPPARRPGRGPDRRGSATRTAWSTAREQAPRRQPAGRHRDADPGRRRDGRSAATPADAAAPARRAEVLPRRARRGGSGRRSLPRLPGGPGRHRHARRERERRRLRCSCCRRSRQMQAWFEAQPAAFYFTPRPMHADAPNRWPPARRWPPPGPGCPASSISSPAAFGPTDLYAPPDLAAAYVSGRRRRRPPVRHHGTQPVRHRSFDTVRTLRALLARPGAASFGPEPRRALRRRLDGRVHRRPGHDLGRLPARRRDHDRRHPDRPDPAAARARRRRSTWS